MFRIYKTLITIEGIPLYCDVLFSNNEMEYNSLLNASGKSFEEFNKKQCLVHYTVEPLYFDMEQQRNIVYHIANANNLNTYTEFWDFVKKHYKEFLSVISSQAVVEELNFMASFVLDGEKLYPKIKRIIVV